MTMQSQYDEIDFFAEDIVLNPVRKKNNQEVDYVVRKCCSFYLAGD